MPSSPQPTSVVHAMRRRWYLVVVGLLIGAGVIATTLIVAPVTYTAQADVLLVPPKAPDASNPLLELGGLEDVPVTISRSVFTDQAVAALSKQGVTSGYSVATDFTTSAPLLLVTGAGNTPAQALAAMQAVAKLVPLTLLRLQDQQRVSADARITTLVIHADTAATEVTRTRTRLLFIAVLIAALFTIGLPVATERLSRRRSGRGAQSVDPAEPHTLVPSAVNGYRDDVRLVYDGHGYVGHGEGATAHVGYPDDHRAAPDAGHELVAEVRRNGSGPRRRAARHAAEEPVVPAVGPVSPLLGAAPALGEHENTSAAKVNGRRRHASPQRHDPAPPHPAPADRARPRTPRPGQAAQRPK